LFSVIFFFIAYYFHFALIFCVLSDFWWDCNMSLTDWSDLPMSAVCLTFDLSHSRFLFCFFFISFCLFSSHSISQPCYTYKPCNLSLLNFVSQVGCASSCFRIASVHCLYWKKTVCQSTNPNIHIHTITLKYISCEFV